MDDIKAEQLARIYDPWLDNLYGGTSTDKDVVTAQIDVDDGWAGLLQDLLRKLKMLALGPDFRIVQIKEKFGGLRVYWEGVDDKELRKEVMDLVQLAEELSYKTCEKCGSMDGVETKGAWLKSFCQNCR